MTIINFSILGTIEERVLEVLSRRIRVFEETIGGLDPILGDVEDDLKRIFLLAAAEAERALDRLEQQIEARVRAARDAERRLADLIMDTKSFRQDEVRHLLERKGAFDTGTMQRFVLGALDELGVQIAKDTQIPGVYDLRFRGKFLRDYPHLDGSPDPEFARWLLDRAGRSKREEWGPHELPARDETFERAVALADQYAIRRLLDRQAELAVTNRERLDTERMKLERFYQYRERRPTRSWKPCGTLSSGSRRRTTRTYSGFSRFGRRTSRTLGSRPTTSPPSATVGRYSSLAATRSRRSMRY